MIAGLKPYAATKDSGVPWLGEVPEHWCLRRTKTILRERVQKGFSDEPLLAATQTKGVVRKEEYENRTVLALKDLHLLKLVRVGDFVISLRSFQGGIEYARQQGIISPAYTVLYPTEQGMRGFLALLFKSRPYIENLSLYVTGIRQGQNIDYAKLSRSELPLPPLPEQAAIVRFLDHADWRIRRYVRAKQRLIKLLKEQKQAIVHRAVTCGLNPDVRLKPSGVDWLGDVPARWAVLPIKRAFVSLDYGISESATDEGTIPLLTMGNIKDGRVTIPKAGGVTTVDSSLLLCAGDLLFNRTNSSDLVGKVGLFLGAEVAVTFASYLVRMRPRPEHEPEYLNLVLNDTSILSIARREAIPSLHQSNLNPTRYGRLQVSLPSLDEQRAILQYLKGATSDLDRAIVGAHRELSLLGEYRIRLIAEVVTGKLDVRAAAANLPDKAEEREALDECEVLTEGEEDIIDADLDAAPEEAKA